MKRIVLLLAVLLLALAGCRSGVAQDPILKLAAEESLAKGKELLAKQKYAKARPYFTHAFEIEPNSPVGREGLLLAADTYYQEGGTTNYVQAEAKYRDFLNRFPTSEYAAQAQEQIALVRNNLAEHEFQVGRFYLRYGLPVAAAQRFDFLLKEYPQYPGRDRVMYNLGLAYSQSGKPEEASKTFEQLRSEFPQSPFLAEIPEKRTQT